MLRLILLSTFYCIFLDRMGVYIIFENQLQIFCHEHYYLKSQRQKKFQKQSSFLIKNKKNFWFMMHYNSEFIFFSMRSSDMFVKLK